MDANTTRLLDELLVTMKRIVEQNDELQKQNVTLLENQEELIMKLDNVSRGDSDYYR